MAIVDLRGKPCPIPVIEAKKLLAAAPAGASVDILVDNDIARQNLQKMAEGESYGFAFEPGPDGAVRVTLQKAPLLKLFQPSARLVWLWRWELMQWGGAMPG